MRSVRSVLSSVVTPIRSLSNHKPHLKVHHIIYHYISKSLQKYTRYHPLYCKNSSYCNMNIIFLLFFIPYVYIFLCFTPLICFLYFCFAVSCLGLTYVARKQRSFMLYSPTRGRIILSRRIYNVRQTS